ncbi:MAG TPA: hypothetical protein VF032_17430 [Thermoleophilaceae bacterium]
MFEAALAAQTVFWGGQGNIIFPHTREFTDSELPWELADRFDADAFVNYAPTWSEWAETAPAEHRRAMDKLHRRVEQQSSAQAADDYVAAQAK